MANIRAVGFDFDGTLVTKDTFLALLKFGFKTQPWRCLFLFILWPIFVINFILGGDLSRVSKLIRMGIFVNAPDDYVDHPKVANGASDLMVNLMGDAGKHARFAVGVSGLPFGVAVEVDRRYTESRAELGIERGDVFRRDLNQPCDGKQAGAVAYRCGIGGSGTGWWREV